MTASPTAVVFDLGGVLIDWNPRYLYRSLFAGDDAAMERFLAEVCSAEWNHQQDAGRPWAEAVAELSERHPDQRELIEAYHLRWAEMLGEEIPGTAAIVEELHAAGVPLYALTNWSAETFDVALDRFPVLGRFDGIVVSGVERMAKPDPRFFRLLYERYELVPSRTFFVDDQPRNVAAATGLGMSTHLFRDSATLKQALITARVLPDGQISA